MPRGTPRWPQIFSTLGALRDRDVIAQTLSSPRAAAQRAGLAMSDGRAPLRGVPRRATRDTAVFRERRLHRLLLALIGLALAGEQPSAASLLIDVARKRLTRLHKR